MRKQKDRTYQANSKLKSIEFQNKNIGAQIAVGGAMATTAKAMGEMNKIVRPEAIGADMRAFQQANMKMEMTDEMSKFCATLTVVIPRMTTLGLSTFPPGAMGVTCFVIFFFNLPS